MKLGTAALAFAAGVAIYNLFVLAAIWVSAPTVEPVDMDSVASFQEADPDYSYPVMGYAVYSQGTILAGHGWSR